MKERNINKINLWSKEILRLLDIYDEIFNRFNFLLVSCSMGEITFHNGNYFMIFCYSYDRYQIDIEMPMSMIKFNNGTIEKNLIEIFNEKIENIDFYEELKKYNTITNDQSLTYKILIDRHLIDMLETKRLL